MTLPALLLLLAVLVQATSAESETPPPPEPLTPGPVLPPPPAPPSLNLGVGERAGHLLQAPARPTSRSAVVSSDWGLWPWMWGTPEVMYKFGDATVDQNSVLKGIQQIESTTCIKFKEAGFIHLGPHIIIRNSPSLCTSYRGKQGAMIFGQDLLLTRDCAADAATVLHFLGHALGLHHEQSRADRSAYVDVVTDNIVKSQLVNFRAESARSLNTIYDYYSVMHSGPLAYSSNGDTTMFAKDPRAQALMAAPRTELSFMDKLGLNTAYKCIDFWQNKCPGSSNCQNLGYLGPNCACVCPDGTTGSSCEVRSASYTEALITRLTPLTAEVTAAGTITSPGYPTPSADATVFTKVITAPVCNKVQLTFDGFQMAGRCEKNTCCEEGLEIRLSLSAWPPSSKWYCSTEIAAAQTFTSESNQLVLVYAKTALPGNTNQGFSVKVAFQPIAGCTG